MNPAPDFGIAPSALARLRALFDGQSGLRRVWIFGSRARGDARPESDIDIAIEAPDWTFANHARLLGRIESLELLYGVDAVLLDDALDANLRAAIDRDRKIFWEPRPSPTVTGRMA
ncbi:nucleotidyltransferase family protein [Ramlibacter sp.]|uniref:nucleotidyltransferase family protein n=1 Tax=Ramlibacter sp. TaxID=1917967 RepID=UPI003D0E9DDF